MPARPSRASSIAAEYQLGCAPTATAANPEEAQAELARAAGLAGVVLAAAAATTVVALAATVAALAATEVAWEATATARAGVAEVTEVAGLVAIDMAR
mmetsp:Transcript_496/g.800  ORF Transcript_496/g.800 Transcript_496/m.800 type:complete len:98 (+) Transcript_496:81-374(+)